MGQKAITKNTLFYGDNLDIMRQYLADESVDLIYLDPPFNSSRNYNVLYKDESGAESQAQMVAFEDTWHWSKEVTEPEFLALKQQGDKLAELLTMLVNVIGRNPMTAYLVMMSSRLVELHRVLKPTGSLYLHCDPTASRYLGVILDMIFGAGNLKNEIIWQRINAKGNVQKKFGAVHDTIFVYVKKSGQEIWNQLYRPLDPSYVEKNYRHVEEGTGRRYRLSDITAPIQRASSGQIYEWKGWSLPATRCWVYAKEKMEELDKQGRIVYSKTGYPNYKRYLDEIEGEKIPDVWTDINVAFGNESLGYPTQKPLALLERIIQASSNPGDIVLDPFCGCGTAVHAAQKLGRKWIGIDITRIATTLIKSRLYDAFQIEAKKDYDLIGEPTTLDEARHLATKDDRYQFQWWALGLLPARPQGGQGDSKQGKKGADGGIDGVITFQDELNGPHKRILVQVKSGKVQSNHIRDLIGTVNSDKQAVMGVFITLEPPTDKMELAALKAEQWHSTAFNRSYPKIQILTIEQLLNGAKVQFPGTDTTLRQAQREPNPAGAQPPLL